MLCIPTTDCTCVWEIRRGNLSVLLGPAWDDLLAVYPPKRILVSRKPRVNGLGTGQHSQRGLASKLMGGGMKVDWSSPDPVEASHQAPAARRVSRGAI